MHFFLNFKKTEFAAATLICCPIILLHNEKKTSLRVVKFVSEQVNLLKNEKGKILKGNDEYIENHTDYWTFSKDLKSNNPNWKLVVTKTG